MPALIRKLLSVVQNEPAAVAATLQALVALLVARYHLTSGQAAAIDAAAVAVLGVVAAAFSRPFKVQALSGLLAAIGTLLAAFAVHLPPGWVGVWSAVLAAVTLLGRERKTVTVAELNRARREGRAPVPGGYHHHAAPSL
jgi:hypothetical protein